MPSRRRNILQWFAIVTGAIVLLIGILLGAFQFAVTRVPEYRVQLQSWLSENTGLTIEFSKLSARLRIYGPELVFHDAVVRAPDPTIVLATAKRGSVGFDLWASVSTGRLTAGRFSLESPRIGLIRAKDGGLQLVGQSALPDRDASKPFAIGKLPVGRFRVSDAEVSFRDEATGRGPWALSGVSFNLDRQPDSLELKGDAALPASLGKSLQFTARADGQLEASHQLISSFSIQGEQIDLAGWADVLPDEWPAPETGRGSMYLSGGFRGTQLVSVAAKVDFNNIAAVAPAWTVPLPGPRPLRIRPDALTADDSDEEEEADEQQDELPAETARPQPAEMLSYKRIAFNAAATRIEDGWKVSATDLDVTRESGRWQARRLQAQWTKQATGAATLAASADQIQLQALWPLLAYLPQSDALARVRAMHARGTIDDLKLEAKRAAAETAPQYSLQAHIESAGFAAVQSTPGFSGLSGELRATHERGELQLQAQQAQLDIPWMFRAPLPIRSLTGGIQWQRDAGAMRVSGTGLQVQSVDGDVEAKFALRMPGDGSSPVMDLTAQVSNLNAASASKYLPANRLTARSLDWLDNAFVAGRVTSGDVRFQGPVRSFPFRGGEGEFVARALTDGLTFNYQRGWEPATQVAAQVEFRNEGMKVLSGTATLAGLRVSQLSGDFADFKQGNIAIKATANGDLNNALKYLQASPVSPALGDTFQKLNGKGATQAAVSLWLPLKHIADRRILVATRFKDASVSLAGLDMPVSRLSGTLRIRQSLPEAANLHGQWLGGPVAVTIQPEEQGRARFKAQGEASADKLAALLHLPVAVKLSGDMPWALRTELSTAKPGRLAQKFTLTSTLEGLGIGLPHPVGKPEYAQRALRAELEYLSDDVMLTRASLGDLRALVRLRRSAKGWGLDRGSLRADAVAAALPNHGGLRIEGFIDSLTLDDWFALRGQGTGNMRIADFLHAANVRVGSLSLFGFKWPEVRGIVQATNAGWQIDVGGTHAAGSLLIPEDLTGTQPLTASMERLIVTGGGPKKQASATPSDPRRWPVLNAFIANLSVDTHQLGKVELRTSRVPAGIRIDTLTVAQETLQAEASGQWLMSGGTESTTLSAKVVSSDVGGTLRALNYTQFMDAKSGQITANLSWPGGFDGDFLGRASGTLSVGAEDGQLLSVQPGAGRVLGLLSLAALPRRLALDFSDVTDKGLGFDTIHGDFELRRGNAFTSNLLLRGPAAEIGIAGRTGLGSHDYDQTAVVTGNLGATLPVAGALAGGPAVGAALLVFSRVFKEPLKGIARGYYKISGSWDQPVVERVDAAQVKEAAANERGA